MAQKYKITINELQTHGGVAKLERDGFTREKVISEMYKQTEGMSQRDREKMVSKLYDRERPC